ncbi:MAG: FeoC-like transcriptional regulator [Acidimicrobiia bacterium]|jgi:hypothetical protein
MRLADLTREIESATGSLTVADLAARLDTSPATVDAMLVALRASGRLATEGGGRRAPTTGDGCAAAGSCTGSCPGPDRCPFTVELVTGFRIRSTGRST